MFTRAREKEPASLQPCGCRKSAGTQLKTRTRSAGNRKIRLSVSCGGGGIRFPDGKFGPSQGSTLSRCCNVIGRLHTFNPPARPYR